MLVTIRLTVILSLPLLLLASPTSGNKAWPMGELGGGFQDFADPQDGLLIEGPAGDLQPERQPVSREPGRDRDRRQSCQISRYREDVVQIHRDRVLGFLA